LRKLFIGASIQNVEHMIIDGVHLTENLEEWEIEFENLEEMQSEFTFKSLEIKNSSYEAPEAIFIILNSFSPNMNVKIRSS